MDQKNPERLRPDVSYLGKQLALNFTISNVAKTENAWFEMRRVL